MQSLRRFSLLGLASQLRCKPLCISRCKHSFYIPPEKVWDIHKQRPQNQNDGPTPDKFDYYQSAVWQPHFRDEDGNLKAREVYHYRENVRGSTKKYWPSCHLALGLPIDEAIMQLQAIPKKYPMVVAEVLLEAQERAITECGIRFKSNLWVADCKVTDSFFVAGMRKHARMRFGKVKYKFSNILVYLQEGKAPPFVTRVKEENGWDKIDKHIKYLRSRDIKYPV